MLKKDPRMGQQYQEDPYIFSVIWVSISIVMKNIFTRADSFYTQHIHKHQEKDNAHGQGCAPKRLLQDWPEIRQIRRNGVSGDGHGDNVT